jgi:phosphatidylserine synthase
MVDAPLRKSLEGVFSSLAKIVDRPYLSADRITYFGLALGLGGAFSAWQQSWLLALVLWLASRVADGIDGPLARRRVDLGGMKNPAGGYLDIMADFTVYGSFVVGVAHGSGQTYLPFLLVLFAYYLNGTSFLAFSSIGEKEGVRLDDGRSLSFLYGLAEATETIVIHCAWCIFPHEAAQIASVWAVMVLMSAGLRFYHSNKLLAGRIKVKSRVEIMA